MSLSHQTVIFLCFDEISFYSVLLETQQRFQRMWICVPSLCLSTPIKKEKRNILCHSYSLRLLL